MNCLESELACSSQCWGGTLRIYRVFLQEPQWAFTVKLPQRCPLHQGPEEERVNPVKHSGEFSIKSADSKAERPPGPCSRAEGKGTSSRQLLPSDLPDSHGGKGRAAREGHLGRSQARDTGAPRDSDFTGFTGVLPGALLTLER